MSLENDILITETIYSDLRIKTKKETPMVVRRSKGLITYFRKFVGNRQLHFETSSGTTRGKFWNQIIWIKLPYRIKGLAWNSVYKALSGDLKLYCSCPAFKWWGQYYFLSSTGSVFGRRSKIYPVVNNPKLRGALCKHLYLVVGNLHAHLPLIVRDVKAKHKMY